MADKVNMSASAKDEIESKRYEIAVFQVFAADRSLIHL
jgi:hypothetical protein